MNMLTKAICIVVQQAVKKEPVMLKSPKSPNKKGAQKMVAVIKNGHTAAELKEMGERLVNHQGPYLTLAETVAIEKAKQAGHTDKQTPKTVNEK